MTTTGATPPAPPPPPPPPPPARPVAPTWAGLPGQATTFVAMAKGAWREGMSTLDREAGRVGLGTTTRTGSVWPVLGFGFLVVALIADRIRSSHAVPVRWLVVLLILGLVVVAGQLREGGRLPMLKAMPSAIGSPVPVTCLVLLLAAQQLDFLNLGFTQVAWFAALVCVSVPLFRSVRQQNATAVPPSALRQSAPLLGAVLVVLAVIIGWLPGQYGPHWFWVVVLLGAAGLAVVSEVAKLPGNRVSLPVVVTESAFWVLTALASGVAVVAARLQVTSVLWLAAAYVLGREAWRRLAADGGPVPLRSRAGLALTAIAFATLSLFAQSNGFVTAGYYYGGLSYDPYSTDANGLGYVWDSTRYYAPGIYYAGSGRGQPFTIPVVAGLAAMAGVVRRRRMTTRLRVATGVVVAGALIWAFAENSVSYFSTWVFIIGVLAAGVAASTARSAATTD